jgi:hypothetical protein
MGSPVEKLQPIIFPLNIGICTLTNTSTVGRPLSLVANGTGLCLPALMDTVIDAQMMDYPVVRVKFVL